jgi:hypothetical protein
MRRSIRPKQLGNQGFVAPDDPTEALSSNTALDQTQTPRGCRKIHRFLHFGRRRGASHMPSQCLPSPDLLL